MKIESIEVKQTKDKRYYIKCVCKGSKEVAFSVNLFDKQLKEMIINEINNNKKGN